MSGLSGEIVIPLEILDKYPIISQLKRTPTFTGFESGWHKFSIVSVHLHPRDSSNGEGKPTDQGIRKEKVWLLTEVLKTKLRRTSFIERKTIVLGDTNLYAEDTDIVTLLAGIGFKESTGLSGKLTNTSLNQIYDRFFLNVNEYFKLNTNTDGEESGGVFNLFKHVSQNTPDSINAYKEFMLAHKESLCTLTNNTKIKTYFNRYWKRNQISDHLPVWLEINTDSSNSFF